MSKDTKGFSSETLEAFKKILDKFQKVAPMLDILTGNEEPKVVLYGESEKGGERYDSIGVYGNRVVGFSFEEDGKTSGFVGKKETIISVSVKMDEKVISLTIYNGTLGYNVDVDIGQKANVADLIDFIFSH